MNDKKKAKIEKLGRWVANVLLLKEEDGKYETDRGMKTAYGIGLIVLELIQDYED